MKMALNLCSVLLLIVPSICFGEGMIDGTSLQAKLDQREDIALRPGQVVEVSESLKFRTAGQRIETGRPNVLVFMSDDIGYGDIHAFNPGNNHTPTPNLDELAAAGISFLHAHSPASLCAPTRYAILTGNHVYRGRHPHGIWSPLSPSQITEGQETLGDQLQKNGYRTAFFGKIHMGGIFKTAQGETAANFDEADFTKRFTDGPLDHGFDYSLGLPSGIQKNPLAFFKNDRLARYDTASGAFKTLTSKEIKRHFLRITDISVKEQWDVEVPGTQPLFVMDNYTTETVGPLMMHNALRFLDNHFAQNPEQPFYIHYMSPAGHRPYAPPLAFNVSDPFNTKDTSAPGAIRVRGMTPTKRTDMIYETDVAMGLFMEKLEALGQLRNTIIVYTSDNGAEVSENLSWSNPVYNSKDGPAWYRGPYGGDRVEKNDYPEHEGEQHVNGQGIGLDGKALRGTKSFVYEGGHRVPLIMRWGGGKAAKSILPPGTRVTDQFISLTDLYRTICTLAGVKVPEDQAMDSFDFSRFLTDPESLSSSNPPVRDLMAIQAWRVADSAPVDNKRMVWSFYSYGSDHTIWDAIISKSRRATDFSSVNADELYLLTDDEDQSENIIDSRKALVNSLTREFKAFLKKGATHSGQLDTPEKARDWQNIVASISDNPAKTVSRQIRVNWSGSKWKYIENQAERPADKARQEKNPRLASPQLCNLKQDPVEEKDLVDEFPEIAEMMQNTLDRIRAQGSERMVARKQ